MQKIAKRKFARIFVNDLLALKAFVKAAKLPPGQSAFKLKIRNMLRRVDADMRQDTLES